MVTGKSNENEIIIRAGLDGIDEVYLIPPEDAVDFRWNYLDTAIVNKYKREDARLKPKKMEEEDEKFKKQFMPPEGMGRERKRRP